MSFDNYERTRKQLAFIFLWLGANILGCAAGWAIAETVGQWLSHTTQWGIAVAATTAIFEISVWICRGSVLLFVGDYSNWKRLDTFILVIAEAFGWLVGEGFYEVTGPNWPSAGPVWGVLLAGSLWMLIWFIRQPRTGTRWWAVAAALWTLFGFVVISFAIGFGLTFSMEVGEWVSKNFNVVIGRAISGAMLGLLVGSMTGLPFLRLLKWSELTRL